MQKRIFSIILVLFISVIGALPTEKAYASEETNDSDVIDYIFEYAKHSSYVLMGTYQMDGLAKIMGIENLPGQMTRDFVSNGLDNVKYNVKEAHAAVKDVWNGLTETVKSNWRKFYEKFKGVNIVISPEVMPEFKAEFHIDAFNREIINNYIIQFPEYDIDDNYIDGIMEANEKMSIMNIPELASYMKSRGDVRWPDKLPTSAYEYISSYYESRKDPYEYLYIVDAETINGKFTVFIPSDHESTIVSEKRVYNNRYCLMVYSAVSPARAFIKNIGSSKEVYASSQSLTLENNENQETGNAKRYFISYGSTVQPFISLNVKKIYVMKETSETGQTGQTVINNISQFYEGVSENINYEIINNYYNYEYMPAVPVPAVINEEGDYIDNRYYNYTTNNIYNNVNNYEHVINNETYTETINNYIYNKTYTGGNITENNSNVTYITNINQIPDYVPPTPISPTPIPTPIPTPVPTPEPGSTPTPTPSAPPVPEEPTEYGSINFEPLYNLGETISTKLPFSIPFDIYNMVKGVFGGVRGSPPVFEAVFPKEFFPAEQDQKIRLDFGDKSVLDWPMLVSAARSVLFSTFVIIFLKNIKKLMF